MALRTSRMRRCGHETMKFQRWTLRNGDVTSQSQVIKFGLLVIEAFGTPLAVIGSCVRPLHLSLESLGTILWQFMS